MDSIRPFSFLKRQDLLGTEKGLVFLELSKKKHLWKKKHITFETRLCSQAQRKNPYEQPHCRAQGVTSVKPTAFWQTTEKVVGFPLLSVMSKLLATQLF